MKPRGKELARFSRAIAEELGDGASTARLADQKELFISLATEGSYAASRFHHRTLIAAAACLAAGLLGFLFFNTNDHIGFSVGRDEMAGKTGVWLDAPASEPILVRFDQGSRVLLKNSATAQVAKSTEEEVLIDLSAGLLEADIQGNHKTRWLVAAGPFRVTVLGTVFSVDWDAANKVVDVKVARGVVLVQGAGLSDHGIKVAKGNHLRADSRTGFMSLNAIDSTSYYSDQPSLLAFDTSWESIPDDARTSNVETRRGTVSSFQNEAQPADRQALLAVRTPRRYDSALSFAPDQPHRESGGVRASAAPESARDALETTGSAAAGKSPVLDSENPRTVFKKIDPIAGVDTDTALESSSEGRVLIGEEGYSSAPLARNPAVASKSTAGDDTTTWLALYEKERYAAAVKSAEAAGFETLLSHLDRSDLWKLIDATRNAGRSSLSVDALLAYRSRFPETNKAKVAAFLLGKIHSDQLQDKWAASKWFKTYLEEDPRGPLAEEALGRRIVLCNNLSKSEEAESAAKAYLKKYPNGSFREVARAVVKGL